MTSSPGSDPSAIAALSGWSLTLIEPLMSLRRRGQLEDQMSRLFVADPAMVTMFLAGVISDQVMTLPDADPWRTLRPMYGGLSLGQPPAQEPGATTAAGNPFGTWRDEVDLVPLVYSSPYDDPGLMALAGDDLTAAAAAILGAGGYGWSATASMIDEVREVGDLEVGGQVQSISGGVDSRDGIRLHFAKESAIQAVRWAVHRRRGYMGFEDQWPAESAFRWAWRASRSATGKAWSQDDVDRALEAEKVRQDAPADRPADDVADQF